MNETVIRELIASLKGLSRQVYLINEDGVDLLSGQTLPISSEAGQDDETYLFYSSRMRAGFKWVLEGPDSAAQDFFLLLDRSLQRILRQYSEGSAADAYRRLIESSLTPAQLNTLIQEQHLIERADRIVYLMQLQQDQKESAGDILEQVLPLSPDDVLIPWNHSTAVLVRAVSGTEAESDSVDFALAVQESLLSETGLELLVSIGGKAKHLSDLPQSYSQACKAMETGLRFWEDRTVFDYRSMLLPRILSEISPQAAVQYHKMLFRPSNNRLFSAEMLHTIHVFFDKDLNLSDTARQLYIHRNTLVYRLDKIQRETGLDLRKFEDAVTFKILMDLGKCGSPSERMPD